MAASSLSFSPVISFKSSHRPGTISLSLSLFQQNPNVILVYCSKFDEYLTPFWNFLKGWLLLGALFLEKFLNSVLNFSAMGILNFSLWRLRWETLSIHIQTWLISFALSWDSMCCLFEFVWGWGNDLSICWFHIVLSTFVFLILNSVSSWFNRLQIVTKAPNLIALSVTIVMEMVWIWQLVSSFLSLSILVFC